MALWEACWHTISCRQCSWEALQVDNAQVQHVGLAFRQHPSSLEFNSHEMGQGFALEWADCACCILPHPPFWKQLQHDWSL